MRSMLLLVLCTVLLTFVPFSILGFFFLPSAMDPQDYLGRLILGSGVLLLIWLAASIIGRKRFAWYVGAVVYGPFAALGLWTLGTRIAMLCLRKVDPIGGLTWCLVGIVGNTGTVAAFIWLYFSGGARELFRQREEAGPSEAADEAETGAPPVGEE